MRRQLIAFLCLLPALAKSEPIKLAQIENDILVDAAFTVVREAYRRMGMDATLVRAPGERAIKMVEQGQALGDVMHFEDFSRNYPKFVRVPVPVIYADILAFYAFKPKDVRGWSSLESYQLCIKKGIKVIESATEHMRRTVVDHYKQALMMLKVKRCELAILPKHSWLSVESSELDGIHFIEKPIQRVSLYHHVNVAYAAYVPQLTKILQDMEREGLMRMAQADFEAKVKDVNGK